LTDSGIRLTETYPGGEQRPPLPLQTDEVTKVLKSLSARMERWELEGKPMYINP
jgi:hypothetical protein